jgi:hypothetical protein
MSETAIKLMKETFSQSWMQPQCFKGQDIEEELMHSGLDVETDSFYGRLSADGYLDCTDWCGPFDSVEKTAEYLIETYGE